MSDSILASVSVFSICGVDSASVGTMRPGEGRNVAGFSCRYHLSLTPPRVVAYGSHVDTASLQAARTAGCDPVLPRSKFVKELELGLKEWLTPG